MEDKMEFINREALRMAREVADETGTLLAGNICNTNLYDPNNPEANAEVNMITAIEEEESYPIDQLVEEFDQLDESYFLGL